MATTPNPQTPGNFNWNGQLRECSIQAQDGSYTSYGLLTFPVESCTVTISQDLVHHKRPNVAGAQLESTGLNPYVFKLRIPFIFGLQKGPGETWGTLYPDVFQQVIDTISDQVAPTLDFEHPTMGHFFVKPSNASAPTTTEVRNGQILELELIQTTTDQVATIDILSSATSAANLFDTMKFQLDPPLPVASTSISLAQVMGQINGLISSTTMTINTISSQVTSAINQVKTIENSLKALKTASTSGLVAQLETVKAGLHSIGIGTIVPGGAGHSLNPPGGSTTPASGTIGVYVTVFEMTLAAIAAVVHDSVADIIKLNPALSKTPTIPVGTQVRYYK